MNTVYLEKEYDYVKPKTLAEALEILETKKMSRYSPVEPI